MSCPECESPNIHTDSVTGEQTCMTCGLVLKDRGLVQQIPIYNPFEGDNQQKVNHGEFISPNKTEYVKGSQINYMDLQRIKMGEDRATIYRMRREQLKTTNARKDNRNFITAMAILDTLTVKIPTPNYVKDEAAQIYKSALRKNLLKGRIIVNMIAASYYAAHRRYGLPMKLDTVADMIGLPRADLAHAYRLLHKELGKGKNPFKAKLDKIKPYIGTIVAKAKLPMEVEKRSMILLDRAIEMKLTGGRSPAGMAAGIVYIVAKLELNLEVTQGIIAEVSGVTEVTIRNRYRDLVDNLPEYNYDPPPTRVNYSAHHPENK